jgi:hypothetical protein
MIAMFAAGRFTMKSQVEKEVESKYEKRYEQMLSQVETRFSERLKDTVETVRKDIQTASERSNDVDEQIEVKPDGTHNITRKIRSRESTKTNEQIKTEVKIVEVVKEVEKIVVQEKIVEVEKQVVKEVEKVIPPPSWRVYGIAAVDSPTNDRSLAYGAGTSYALGPIDVGGFGTYNNTRKNATLGLTIGLSF